VTPHACQKSAFNEIDHDWIDSSRGTVRRADPRLFLFESRMKTARPATLPLENPEDLGKLSALYSTHMTLALEDVRRLCGRDSPVGEWLKGVCLTAVFVSSATLARVGAGPTLALTAVHVGGLAAAGMCVLRFTGMPLSPSAFDRLTFAYLFGWVTVPVFALAVRLTGNHAAGLALATAILASGWLYARWRERRTPRGDIVLRVTVPPIPWAVYLLASLYVIGNVVLPFRCFGVDSLVREMYSDGFQRFGTTYALAASVPPRNPFVAGCPLVYYWFALFPYALEFRFIHADLFAIWKSGQAWTAWFLLVGLWGGVRAVFGRGLVAWGALLLGFAFSSYEVFANPKFLTAMETAVGLLPRIKAGWAAAAIRDPDHIIGVVNTYSDQLFIEDFLYIPHNALALIILLTALWWLAEARYVAAAWAVATLAGFNTFYLPVVAPALSLAILAGGGARRALAMSVLLASAAVLFLSLCGIVPLEFPAALGVAMTTALVLGVARTWISRGTPLSDGGMALLTRMAAVAFMATLLLLVLPHPIRNLGALFLNYGPAFPAGLAFVAMVGFFPRRYAAPPAGHVLILLLLGCAACWGLSSFLILQFDPHAPALLKNMAASVGFKINLFNLYHKVSKMVRLAWCLFAALGFALWFPRFVMWPRVAGWLLVAVLLPAALTGVARARTYCLRAPIPETRAAQYLIQHGCTTDTIVLLEDYRFSAINQLAPVSVFYISNWVGGSPGLTHAVGTWADQYLPAGFHSETQRREELSRNLFKAPLDRQRINAIVVQYGVHYILTRKPCDLGSIARQVVSSQGGYLYRVGTAPRAGESD
jgi:hypothetical protein